jgi:hypothetical protein
MAQSADDHHFVRALRTSLATNTPAYGFSLTVAGSFAALMNIHGEPTSTGIAFAFSSWLAWLLGALAFTLVYLVGVCVEIGMIARGSICVVGGPGPQASCFSGPASRSTAGRTGAASGPARLGLRAALGATSSHRHQAAPATAAAEAP